MRLHRLLIAAAGASGAGVFLASSTAPVSASPTAARWSGSISYHTTQQGRSTGIHTLESSSDGRLTILVRKNGIARYQASYHAESTSVADSDCGKQTKRNTWAGGNVRNVHGSVAVQSEGRKYRISHTWPTVEVVHTFTHTSELAGQRNSFGHLCPPNPAPEKTIASANPVDNAPVLRGTSRRNGNLLVGSKRTTWRPCTADATCGAQTRATWTLVRVRGH